MSAAPADPSLVEGAPPAPGPFDHRRAILGALLVFVVAKIIYSFTAARGPVFGDGLELVAAAACDGVPHPTGYPTLMMILDRASSGPGAYARASSICGTLVGCAAYLVALATSHWCSSFRSLAQQRWLQLLPIFAGVMAAFSAGLWNHATCVETYSLQVLLVALAVCLARPRMAAAVPLWWALLLGAAFGLACTNHVTALSLGAIVLLRVVGPPASFRWPRALAGVAAAGAGFAFGLLPYAILPQRAAALPPVNWGDARTLEGFVWLLRGGDYGSQRLMQVAPGVPFDMASYAQFAAMRVVTLVADLGSQWIGGAAALESMPTFALSLVLGLGIVWLLLLGVVCMWSFSRLEAVAWLVAPTLQVAFFFLYNIPDITDYFAALWISLLPFFIGGTVTLFLLLAQRLDAATRDGRLVVLMAALVVIALLANWKAADRSRSVVAQRWIERTLDALPPNALLITHGDYDTYTMWYAQQSLGKRRDVLVVGANFLRSPWYASMVPANEPDAVGRCVRMAEPGWRFTLDEHVEALRDNVIEPNIGKVPIVTTSGDAAVMNALWNTHGLRPIATLATPEEIADDPHRAPGMVPTTLFEFVAPASPAPSAS